MCTYIYIQSGSPTKNIKDKKQYSERRKLILRVHKSLFLKALKLDQADT